MYSDKQLKSIANKAYLYLMRCKGTNKKLLKVRAKPLLNNSNDNTIKAIKMLYPLVMTSSASYNYLIDSMHKALVQENAFNKSLNQATNELFGNILKHIYE